MPFRLPTIAFLLFVALLAAPSNAVAQTQSEQTDPPAAAANTSQPALIAPAPTFSSTAEQQSAPAPDRRRRRPSMVGYIEDASVQSQIRFRYDAGFGNNVPDRAEFFYAKCGCYQFDPPPYQDLEAPGIGPGVPTELNYQQFYAFVERAFTDRLSVFGELPFRSIQPQGFLDFGAPYLPFDNQSGLADIRFGVKADLFSDGDRGVTALVRMSAPTGDAAKGLGSNSATIEPSVLFHTRLHDRVGLEAQLGYWHLFGGSNGVDSPDDFSGDILSWGIGPSFDAIVNDQFRLTPVVELVGWRVLGGFQTACDTTTLVCAFDADGVNIVNIKFGARATVRDRHSFYGGFGWHLTDEVWYDKLFRVEYRLGF